MSSDEVKIDPARVKSIGISTPMMAQAQAIRAVSHFDFKDCSTDDSLMLLSNISSKELRRFLAMAHASRYLQWDGLRYIMLASLALSNGVNGKGLKAVIEISKTPSVVGSGNDVAQSRVAKARNWLTEHL